MRHIKKAVNESTVELDRQNIIGIPKSDPEATLRWKRFSEKRLISKYLLDRQFGLCCYTELNLTDFAHEQNSGYHIEHEKPKSLFPQLTFDFGNLLLCALNSQDLEHILAHLQFGGHFKKSKYDAQLFISPHQYNCREFFVYSSSTGEITPNLSRSTAEQQKAQYTIDLLNLNAPFLKAERLQWLQEIEDCLEPFIDSGDKASIELIAETELLPYEREHPQLMHSCSQLRKFHSAVRSIFGAVGEMVIRTHCPTLD